MGQVQIVASRDEPRVWTSPQLFRDTAAAAGGPLTAHYPSLCHLYRCSLPFRAAYFYRQRSAVIGIVDGKPFRSSNEIAVRLPRRWHSRPIRTWPSAARRSKQRKPRGLPVSARRWPNFAAWDRWVKSHRANRSSFRIDRTSTDPTLPSLRGAQRRGNPGPAPEALDCFATLAMTGRGRRGQSPRRRSTRPTASSAGRRPEFG